MGPRRAHELGDPAMDCHRVEDGVQEKDGFLNRPQWEPIE